MDLEHLSDNELQALVESLEVVEYDQRRNDIVYWASNNEVPGTPRHLTDAEKAAVSRRKRGDDRLSEDGKDPDIAEEDVEDFYPQKLQVAEHQKLILTTCIDMLEGKLFRGRINGQGEEVEVEVEGTIIMAPPGSAKSSYASVVVPSYCLGYFQDFDVICASYAAELARRFGRRVRHMVRDPEYPKTFNTQIVGDNQAVDQWSLDNGSSYRAVGVLGGVTGFRADLLIIDDPIAGREEADSEVIRDKIWAAFQDDLFSRLKPEFGKIMLIQTRWHQDDPAGRLLGSDWKGQSGLWRGTDGRIWYVLNIPMEAEHRDDPLGRRPGERLWPERFTERFVELAKLGNVRTWSALYQQRPSSGDGNILTRDLWRCWPHGNLAPTKAQLEAPLSVEPPRDISMIVLSFDTAFEEGEENDYSAMTAWGIFDHQSTLTNRLQQDQGNVIMIGAWREQIQAAALIEVVEQMHDKFAPWRVPIIILVEKKASGHQLIQEIRRRRFAPVVAWTSKGPAGARGKIPRAYAAQVIMDQGTVWYMPGPRTMAVIDECASFPRGTWMDWCFVAGTLIALKRGLTPIQDVRIGDEALTPLGWRRVTAAGFTGIRPVVERAGLIGTKDHPIFTLEQLYQPLESVTSKTTVSRVTLCSLIKTIRRRPWSTEATATASSAHASTTSAATGATAGEPSSASTSRFGSTPLAWMSCRTVTKSITRAAIHSTIALKTWSAYQRLRIARCLASARTRCAETLTSSGPRLWRGIAPQWAGRGTAPMPAGPANFSPATGATRSSQSRQYPAASAASSSSASTSDSTSARSSVRTPNPTPGSRPQSEAPPPEWCAAAFTAAATFLSSSDPERATKSTAHPDAGVNISGSENEIVAPVYNLTVDGLNCYYANGVLVHNCDTVTQFLIWVRDGGLLDVPTDIPTHEEHAEDVERDHKQRRETRGGYGTTATRKTWDAGRRRLY